MLEIRYDKQKLKKLERELKAFGQRALPKVMSRSLNRAASGVRTKLSRDISKKSGIKVGEIRKRIYILKATYNSWQARHRVSNKRLPIVLKKARQNKQGVTYKDAETGSRVLVKHAFIATMPSGHKGVWIRVGYPFPGMGQWYEGEIKTGQPAGRLPILELFDKSFSTVYKDAVNDFGYRKYAESILLKNIHGQTELILKRKLPA